MPDLRRAAGASGKLSKHRKPILQPHPTLVMGFQGLPAVLAHNCATASCSG
ncbi:MAG: hypothetical protein IPM82_26930 [Saprospiraceae bacterium]|nr:hypothetical protein [Saprospiraceae bacterium]